MGIFGLSSKEQLSQAVADTNSLIRRAQSILTTVGPDMSRLSYSQKSDLRDLGGQILTRMNDIIPLVERNQNLMMATVPGFDGPVPAVTWMMWAMQWFDSFERTVKPAIF